MANKPVKRIEVDTKHAKLRGILAAIFLVIALVSVGYGVSQMVNKSESWRQVEVSSNQINCGADLVFNYCFGKSGLSVNQEYRSVSTLYTQGCEEGYRLFYREGELSKLNAAPNTSVKVDEALYAALEQIQNAGNRSLYLAPVYDEYARMFLCETEEEAAIYDPGQNTELAQQVAEMAAYCNEPAMIDLELLGSNQVRLKVSAEYLQYAESMGITEFLDFGWMKNAFIVDHIANLLEQEGFTYGYLASYDGFTRNLDSTGQTYSINVFDRRGTQVDKPAVMDYEAPASLVQLRDFPMAEEDRWHYFAFSNGRIASVYADPADGMTKCAVTQLVSYSREQSCVQILLEIAPVYLQDALQEAALGALTEKDISSLWCTDGQLRYNQQSLVVRELAQGYTAQYVTP